MATLIHAQIGFRVYVTEDTQELAEHNPVPCALG